MALKEVGWSKRCLQEFATNNKGSHGRVPAVLLSRRVQETAGKPRCGQRRGQNVLLTSDIFRCLKRSSWKSDENPSFIPICRCSPKKAFMDRGAMAPLLGGGEVMANRDRNAGGKGWICSLCLVQTPQKNRSQSGSLENIICWCWV
jgi:hypothetical protein